MSSTWPEFNPTVVEHPTMLCVVWCDSCERRASGSHKISRKWKFRYFPPFVRFHCVLFGFIFSLQPRKPSHALEISTRIRDYAKNRLSYNSDVKSINFYCLLRSEHDEPCCGAKVFSLFFCMSRQEKRKKSSSLKMFSLSGQKQHAYRKFNVHRLLSSRIHQFCDNLRTVCKVLCGTSFVSELLQGFKS